MEAVEKDMEEVSGLCDEADKAIQEAYMSKKEAWEYKEATDEAVKEIKEIIEEYNGDDSDDNSDAGDCHEEH
jgi:ElaB/YqjD/DUF883 family membrane-anchored ribosome-binding protein